MTDKVEKVFVYGTLKVGGRFAKALDKVRRSSTPAKVVGKLMNVNGFYPGLIDGDSIVYGEVHEYKEFDKVLEHMDNVEGHVRHKPEFSLYRRKVVKAEMKGGDTAEVYAYFFNQPTEGMDEVETGIWKIEKETM